MSLRSLFAVLLLTVLTTDSAFAAVQSGDKLNVVVYNHPELSTQPVVDASGNISLPLVGSVRAATLEPAAIADRIRVRLETYIRHAAVDVQLLAQGTSIFVVGGPGGVLAYTPGEHLTTAVQQALASGRTQVASGTPLTVTASGVDQFRTPVDLHAVRVNRDGATVGTYDVAALLASGLPGIPLVPGDTIGLLDKPVTVRVTGQVQDAGIAHLAPGEPLSDAFLQVGGVQPTAAFRMILERDGRRIPIGTTSPEYSAPAQDGDVIDVPPAVRVSVTGDVAKPGDVTLRGDPSLISALYYAGGPDAVGDLRRVAVVHRGTQQTYDLTALTHGAPGRSRLPDLADGDTVYVPANPHHVDYRGIFQSMVSATLFLLRY